MKFRVYRLRLLADEGGAEALGLGLGELVVVAGLGGYLRSDELPLNYNL
jgi:hypothetical protein